ncbi:polyphosphate kinase 1 [Halalkalirubrum salinum]|uniref:polyphosphate kinase 1 n=1 Tax=Halalkalirubrum salinum TaxID=2563889 RepID=UPI0010FB5265|nr:polyphosphate kinase 1 [Halalkalirubrum salinum]
MSDTSETAKNSDETTANHNDRSDWPHTPPIVAESDLDVAAETPVDDPALYLNRELSELSFQYRVLHEASDDRTPLLDRMRFLAILNGNLDEFLMKRIGGLKQGIDAGVTDRTVDGRTPKAQWEEALAFAREIMDRQSTCFHESVLPALKAEGIAIVSYETLSANQQSSLRSYFERSILPTLTPLTFDPAHPFPFISNLSLSLAVVTKQDGDDKKFSRVKIPQNRPRLVPVEQPHSASVIDGAEPRFVPIEQVIEHNLDLLFPNVSIEHVSTFRVTRNAEIRRNEDVAEGLIEMIEDVLRQRRFATVVRLEIADDMPTEVRELLVEQLGLTEPEVFERREPLALEDFSPLVKLNRPELKTEPWTPQPHPRFVGLDADAPAELFEEIKRDDILVHHPYHSFSTTVQAFLDAAAHDPDTLAIKAAIYRTAPDSQVIRSLIEAAKNGKQVAVMVELKARFDEENNLRWVKRLEEEGIHVAYGTIGLKTHSKVALVVRDEGADEGVRLYSHVASGNYHSETAKTYVDLGLFSADRDIGQDLVRLFNSFTGHSRRESYRTLLVAPETLRTRITELIRRERSNAEAGIDAKITAKMNALEDPEIVRELYEAAKAGVKIDLIVRGICRLRPGLEGVSDTISVHSIVGQFLEHSRIFRFENDGEPQHFIGSADWMTRNLDRRVEAVTPVTDPDLKAELDVILETMLADNRLRWMMQSDGSYVQQQPEGEAERDTHQILMQRAKDAAPRVDRDADQSDNGRREPSVDLEEVYLEEPYDP